ncbi:MAG: ABC transporter permease [Granulosicoccus sp.]
MILVIARHECLSLLRSAQTWVIAAILALLFGYLFLQQLESFLGVQDQLALQDYPVGLSGYLSVRYLQPLALAFTFIAPLFAMRAFSDEFRQHTYALWQSSPVSSVALVVGKFAGLSFVMLCFVMMAVGMLLIMRLYVPIDLPLVLCATIGLFLCSCAATACGLYFSSLTRHNLVAIISSLALLVLLWLLGSASFGELPVQAISHLSIANHLSGFFQGYLQSADISYFLLMTGMFLALSVIRLDSLRQNGYS